MMGAEFRKRLDRLHQDLVQQGQRVEALVERAFEAVFEGRRDLAEEALQQDDLIDRVDIEIERAAVDLLILEERDEKQLRMVLTIVKVNNELERIADLAADAAEQGVLKTDQVEEYPMTMRMMANSVVGMIRDGNVAIRDLDVATARTVLASDDTVEKFKEAILDEVQRSLADGSCSISRAGASWQIANSLQRMADHTTNICEQVIYVETGQIVRHSAEGWSDPMSI